MTPKETSFTSEMDRGLAPTDTLPFLLVAQFYLCRGLACHTRPNLSPSTVFFFSSPLTGEEKGGGE